MKRFVFVTLAVVLASGACSPSPLEFELISCTVNGVPCGAAPLGLSLNLAPKDFDSPSGSFVLKGAFVDQAEGAFNKFASSPGYVLEIGRVVLDSLAFSLLFDKPPDSLEAALWIPEDVGGDIGGGNMFACRLEGGNAICDKRQSWLELDWPEGERLVEG